MTDSEYLKQVIQRYRTRTNYVSFFLGGMVVGVTISLLVVHFVK